MRRNHILPQRSRFRQVLPQYSFFVLKTERANTLRFILFSCNACNKILYQTICIISTNFQISFNVNTPFLPILKIFSSSLNFPKKATSSVWSRVNLTKIKIKDFPLTFSFIFHTINIAMHPLEAPMNTKKALIILMINMN